MLLQRIRPLNNQPETSGDCVVYHMSRDQRIMDNHVLKAAQDYAIERKLPLIVVFNVFTQPTIRLKQHYQFMMDGLHEVYEGLKKLSIPFVLLTGDPIKNIVGFTHKHKASALFFDFSPLREACTMRITIAQSLAIPVFEVDSNNVIPLWIASDKEAYSARTIRPKIHKHLSTFLVEIDQVIKHPIAGPSFSTPDFEKALSTIKAEELEWYKPPFKAGEKAAHQQLHEFIKQRLKHYGEDRNKPDKDGLSGLSPYLHYGHISTFRANLEVQKACAKNHQLQKSAEVFFEESCVRRELAQNFCYYNKNYMSVKGAREWAQKTLRAHERDKREAVYTREQLEHAATSDPAWNAAQKEMIAMGKMHGYMRMYWAKKLLEWSKTAQKAIDTAVYLNDKYSLDGFEANGYVGILWAIAGVHDRPWFERPVFGSIRYMNYNGLRRKFDIEAYIQKWA